MGWLRRHLATLAIATLSGACGGTRDEAIDPSVPPLEPVVEPQPAPVVDLPKKRWTIHHARELRGDLGGLVHLDLALSPVDLVGHLAPSDAQSACDGLDLVRLAAQAPNLRSLRVSGCQSALQAGLGALKQLTKLELADVTLDGVTIGRLSALRRLDALSLTRVSLGTDPLHPLAKISPRSLTLQELDRDSPLAELLETWSATLTEVHLVGAWAGRHAMSTLAKAQGVHTLEVRDTRIGNYALSQIKQLTALRRLALFGGTFNDHTPLYLRNLPIEDFQCACPRLGDAGLKALRRSEGIRTIDLPQSSVTGVGLSFLADLRALESLRIIGRDIGPTGFEALGRQPKLEALEISSDIADPSMRNLGTLQHLRVLRLAGCPVGDRAAPEVGKLIDLQELDLGRTEFSDAGLASLEALDQLKTLKLHHTRVTNRGLAHVAKLTKLEVLELDHTDVVDAGVRHLKALTNLRELRLDSTLVTDASVQTLLELPNLERLNLGETVVSDQGADKLASLGSLRVLAVGDRQP